MPEGPEVERLRLQLEENWVGKRIVKFCAPTTSPSPDPKKYAQDGWPTFLLAVLGSRIEGVDRIGKHIWVQYEDCAWQIHLGGTGWFTPWDQTQTNFLHSVNAKTVRVKLVFDDGGRWNYHDSRTWGKWWIKPYTAMAEDPYFQEYGPDWIRNPNEAKDALIRVRSRRFAKEVLCDQKITAGIGNYLSCEILHRAGIHPHTRFHHIGNEDRQNLAAWAETFVQECMNKEDHAHWLVFQKKGDKCLMCKTGIIEYVKDSGGSRGSYFCPKCQKRL